MVRQPLARHGHPLASCDYHAVAAPYSGQAAAALSLASWGRGASGMPVTKTAFMLALEEYIPVADEEEARAEARRPLRKLRDAALAAFRDDFSYCAQMAEAAHGALLRSPLAA